MALNENSPICLLLAKRYFLLVPRNRVTYTVRFDPFRPILVCFCAHAWISAGGQTMAEFAGLPQTEPEEVGLFFSLVGTAQARHGGGRAEKRTVPGAAMVIARQGKVAHADAQGFLTSSGEIHWALTRSIGCIRKPSR
jgi:hypothetical protein